METIEYIIPEEVFEKLKADEESDKTILKALASFEKLEGISFDGDKIAQSSGLKDMEELIMNIDDNRKSFSLLMYSLANAVIDNLIGYAENVKQMASDYTMMLLSFYEDNLNPAKVEEAVDGCLNDINTEFQFVITHCPLVELLVSEFQMEEALSSKLEELSLSRNTAKYRIETMKTIRKKQGYKTLCTELHGSLRRLVAVKDYKDHIGKDETYEKCKVEAWEEARQVLRAIEKQKV